MLHRLPSSAEAQSAVPHTSRLPVEKLQPLPSGVYVRDQAGHRRRCVANEAMVINHQHFHVSYVVLCGLLAKTASCLL